MTPQGTVAFHTLGCKLNFAETSSIGRSFLDLGFEKVSFDEPADVYIINTCSVTEMADRKCRELVRRVKRQQPRSRVVVIGCYAQLKPQEIAQIPGVDLVLGAKEKFDVARYTQQSHDESTGAQILASPIQETTQFVNAYSIGDRTRTFLKVQDGCDYPCTYCTIPLARGKSRSGTIEEVVRNAQDIANQGVREIVLTGVNIGDFGKGFEGAKKNVETFYDLIMALDHQVKDIARFRISSIEPNLLHDDIIRFVADSRAFMPHFHLPLQSGSDKILGLMKRRYRKNLYANRIERIRQSMPHACIGVDVIVGFPGESDKDFLETQRFLTEMDVQYLHVFTYSERANTIAAAMEHRVPLELRKERNEQLRILSEKKKRAFYSQAVGQRHEILWEGKEDGNRMGGFSKNYIRVEKPWDETSVNQVESVILDGFADNDTYSMVVRDERFT